MNGRDAPQEYGVHYQGGVWRVIHYDARQGHWLTEAETTTKEAAVRVVAALMAERIR